MSSTFTKNQLAQNSTIKKWPLLWNFRKFRISHWVSLGPRCIELLKLPLNIEITKKTIELPIKLPNLPPNIQCIRLCVSQSPTKFYKDWCCLSFEQVVAIKLNLKLKISY
jgi:hypothetical protein